MVRPSETRATALYLKESYKVSNARVCWLLGLSKSTASYAPKPKHDTLVADRIKELATDKRRFGHRRLFVFLKREFPDLNHKRSHRIYKGLHLQIGHRKRKKLGSLPRVPLAKATTPNHTWAINFMFDYLESGRRIKTLTTVDEFSKVSPGLLVAHSIRGIHATEFLDQIAGGTYPKVIRVYQGTEFTSRAMLDWAYKHGINLEFTRVRKPNQLIEAFNSRLRDECFNEHVFLNLEDARGKVDEWGEQYNHSNPHSSLNMKTPVQFAKEWETMLAS